MRDVLTCLKGHAVAAHRTFFLHSCRRESATVRDAVTRLPGSPQEVRTVVKEWVCRECDYFEDAEADA